MSKIESAKYDELKARIKPFDIIAFHSTFAAASVIECCELLTHCKGSCGCNSNEASLSNTKHKYLLENQFFPIHVGIVVSRAVLDVHLMKPGELYIFESTSSYHDTPDIFGKHKLGVQIRPLREVLECLHKTSPRGAVWCKLAKSPIDDNGKPLIDLSDFKTFFFEHHNDGYDLPCMLLKSILPFWCCVCSCATEDRLFCSELCVKVFQKVGLVEDTLDAETINPESLFLRLDNKLPEIAERVFIL